MADVWLPVESSRVDGDHLYVFAFAAQSQGAVSAALTETRRHARVCSTVDPYRDGEGYWRGACTGAPFQSWIDRGGSLLAYRRTIDSVTRAAGGCVVGAKQLDTPIGAITYCQAVGAVSEGDPVDTAGTFVGAQAGAVQDFVEGAAAASSGAGAFVNAIGQGIGTIGAATRVAPGLSGAVIVLGVVGLVLYMVVSGKAAAYMR